MKPLVNVASGGELSRIMLAIKTVLAHRDSIDTLIFDEIEALRHRESARSYIAFPSASRLCV